MPPTTLEQDDRESSYLDQYPMGGFCLERQVSSDLVHHKFNIVNLEKHHVGIVNLEHGLSHDPHPGLVAVTASTGWQPGTNRGDPHPSLVPTTRT
jgi:hypothetical protein